MKKLVKTLFFSALILGFSYGALLALSMMNEKKVPIFSTKKISPAVERYRPVFQKYANQNQIGRYTDLLMAVAMQESKGHSPDIMQSSESIGLPRNAIKNPEYSIEVGTKYFKRAIDKSNGNVHLALQSYNYGTGFIDYVNARGGTYSRTLAEKFARSQASRHGWTSYGDPLYVDHVLRYYHSEKQSSRN